MQSFFGKIRLPFRDDMFFSILVLLTLVVPLAFFLGTYEKFEIIKIFLWLVLAGWALIYFGYRAIRRGKDSPAIRSNIFLLLLLIVMIAVSAVSAWFGWDRLNSFFGYYPRFTSSVAFYALWTLTLVLLLASLTRERLVFLLQVLVFDSFLGAGVGLLQSLGVGFYDGPASSLFSRAPGLLGNPNFSSMFLAALVPAAAALFFLAKKLWVKIYYSCVIFLSIATIIALSSRGAWVGLAVEFAILIIGLLIFRFPKKYLLTIGVVLAGSLLLGGLLFNQIRPQNFTQTLHLDETNINLRFFVWDIARQAMQQHPLGGVGPGNFQLYFERLRDRSLANQNGLYDDAHNLFLQIGATTGVPFLGLFIVLLALALAAGLRQVYRERDVIAFALVTGTVGFCIMACFNPVPSACFYLLAVFLAGMLFYESSLYSWRWPLALGVIAGIVGVAAALAGASFLSSEILFFKGYGLYLQNKPQESLPWIQRSIELNPTNAMFFLYRSGDELALEPQSPAFSQDIQRFISMHPQDAISYGWGANLYFIKYDDAGKNIADLRQTLVYSKKMISLDPFYARHVLLHALYLFEDDQLADSLAYAKFAVSLDQQYAPGWLLLARIYQLEDKKDQAVYVLEQGYQQNPDITPLKYLIQEVKSSPDFKSVYIPVVIAGGQLE